MKSRVGLFSFAHMHAHSYVETLQQNPRAEIIGVADCDSQRLEQSAKRHGVKAFNNYQELLAQNLDAAIVASENAVHRQIVELCADAGVKAILCEKPIATSVADASAMIERCAEKAALLYIAFPCRFSPAAVRLRQNVQQGELGDILAIRGTNRGLMPGGWFTDKALAGGGAVIDHTVHVADYIHWLLGKKAIEVYAEIGNGFYHQDFDDTGMLTITYDGGVFATIDTSWSRPQNFPKGDVTLEVIGTKGVAQADLFSQNVILYGPHSELSAPHWGSNLDFWMVDQFLRAASGETVDQLATGQDGLAALEVALGAYRSAEQHSPVCIQPLLSAK